MTWMVPGTGMTATIQRLVAQEGSEDHLAWEGRQRTPAAIAAFVAGAFIFGGTVWRGLALADLPRNGLTESLDRLSDPGSIGGIDSLKIKSYEYFQDQALGVLGSSVIVAIGYLGLGWAL